MIDVIRKVKTVIPSGMCLIIIAIMLCFIPAPAISQTNDVKGFIHNLIGEWIGTYEQLTNGKKASVKYFHAVFKQTSPDTYQTVFEYYRLDVNTGVQIKVGESVMTTKESADGTAVNDISGKGVVMIDPKTSKPEKHDLTEILRVSMAGGLQGDGNGTISVSGMTFGAGRNGKVTDEHSAWSMQNGELKIHQELTARFRVLFFSKSFTITAEFTGKRGSDIAGLMKQAEARLPKY